MEAERLFSFLWHPAAVDPKLDYTNEPPTLVEFTVAKTATGTLLTVIESGFDALTPERRQEAVRMNTSGWATQLVNIEAYLSEQAVNEPSGLP